MVETMPPSCGEDKAAAASEAAWERRRGGLEEAAPLGLRPDLGAARGGAPGED